VKTLSDRSLLPEFDSNGRHRVPVEPWQPTVAENGSALIELVRASMRELPEPQRSTLRLHDGCGWSVARIAEGADEAPEQLRCWVHEGRQMLRTLLDPHMRSAGTGL